MIWLIAAVLFVLYLLLIWRLIGEQDEAQQPGRHRQVFNTDPDATVVLRSIGSWYQLASQAQRTDRILERAALLLDGQ